MPNANPLGNQGWARDDMTGEDLPILAEEDSLTAIIFAESVHALLPETAAALELGHDEISLFFCPRCAKKSRRPDGGVEIFDSKLVVDIPKSGLYDREGLILVEEPNGTVTGERQLEMDGVGVVDLSAWDKDSVTINVIEQRALLDIVTNLDTLAAH